MMGSRWARSRSSSGWIRDRAYSNRGSRWVRAGTVWVVMMMSRVGAIAGRGPSSIKVCRVPVLVASAVPLISCTIPVMSGVAPRSTQGQLCFFTAKEKLTEQLQTQTPVSR
jgi:hypothetical protein